MDKEKLDAAIKAGEELVDSIFQAGAIIRGSSRAELITALQDFLDLAVEYRKRESPTL